MSHEFGIRGLSMNEPERREGRPGRDGVQVDITHGSLLVAHRSDWLADLVRRVLAGEGVERASIALTLVDDATIRELNRRHLGHDWPTDVITFDLSETDEERA